MRSDDHCLDIANIDVAAGDSKSYHSVMSVIDELGRKHDAQAYTDQSPSECRSAPIVNNSQLSICRYRGSCMVDMIPGAGTGNNAIC